ncbi:MAG: substrate-binding domain-containing protein [Aestuariibaculum sp.]
MMKKYTIRDIAELANVSKGTVDRVIHKRGRVSNDALNRVNKVLNSIDYKPNLIAKHLKNNKIYRICVVVPNPEKDPYWIPCIKGINDIVTEFSAFGINIEQFLFDPTNTKSFLEVNKTILSTAPDAILLVPLFYKESLEVTENYKSLNVPVTIFNNKLKTEGIKGFIGQDLFNSGRVAARLLHSLINHGDIAIVHVNEKYKNAVFMQEKEKGFKSYFNKLDHANFNIVKYKLKKSNFEDNLKIFVNEHPNLTGIFVTTSKTYQVAKVLENINRKKMALVGYDLLNKNIDYLKKGTIDFLIHQHPKQQTYFGLKFLIEKLLFDKEIPSQYLLPIDIINSENIMSNIRD